jgi:autotransporter-associated beta strand protein
MLAGAGLLEPSSASAQSFFWGGAGSTTTTSGYNLDTNWSAPPAGAPPVTPGQSAVFDVLGSASVAVTSGPITPGSWTFNANAQSYTITGAALNFSQAGSAGGIIDNTNASQTITIANSIGESVPGVQVQALGPSTLVLAGANSYSGGTTVSGFATLQVTNNSAVGTGTVTLSDGLFQADGVSDLTFSNNFKVNNTAAGSAIDANGVMLTIAGTISDGSGGPGKLTVLDNSFARSGIVVLTGANTYTGGTTIRSCATLQLGDASHTASIVGDVINEGRFAIVNADTSHITSITTDGGFTEFLGANTAGAMTLTNKNGGVLVFGLPGGSDTSTAGSATISNNNAGTIFAAFSNAGTASITNRNNGGMEFFEQASAASAIIVNDNNGFTSFGQPFGTDTPTAGNAHITNNSGGQTIFNAFSTAGSAIITTNSGGSTAFFDNSTGGLAQFVTNGTGVVDFSGSLGPNGDGRITAGSIAGSGSYFIGAGNTLVVGGNNLSTNVSGVIADSCGCFPGSGSLEKVGAGMLTLSGLNTYTGTTTVSGGFLDVEGSIASSSRTTVNAGGALTGVGTVGEIMIASGGIFLPGNGFGTSMTVNGNLAFQSGALYLVQFNSATSTFADATGSAALGGSVRVAFAPGTMVMKQYMILAAAGGVSGTFDGVSAPGGLVGTISTDPTHAYLNFALDFDAKSNLNVNQRNVASTLTNFFNANGGIPAVFASLTPSGLTQVSGEAATGSQQATFEAMKLFMGLLTDPFLAGRDGGATTGGGAQPYADAGDNSLGYAAKRQGAARDALARIPAKPDAARNDLFDPHWSVWGSAYGGGANIDGNAALGSNSANVRAFGFVGGADYRISPYTLAGFALAGGGTNFSVSGFGTGRSDLFQAGAFVRHNVGAAYVSAAAAYGGQRVITDRTVTAAGLDRLHAEFNANAWSGRVEGGYRFATSWMGITPYAAGQFTTFDLPAYAEQVLAGTGTFALNYAAKRATDSRTELGVRTDRSFAVQNGILTLRGRLAWAHDFNTDRNVSAVFQTLPGASFIVNGAAQARDSALTTASAELRWLNGWSAAATFEGEFSNVSSSYAGKGSVRYAW